MGLQVFELDDALEELQRVVEPIAEEMHVPEVHERNRFVIPVTTGPGQIDRPLEDGFSLVPLALGNQRLSLHRSDIETHIGRRVRRQPLGVIQDRVRLDRLAA